MSSAKHQALTTIERLPEEVSTGDILEVLHFREQVERGLDDVAKDRTISHDELKERLAQWRRSVGR